MSRQLDVYTAHAVRLSYRIADIGSRAAALLLDILIQGAASILLSLLLSAVFSKIGGSIGIALIVTLIFALFFGYYIVLEGIGSGQTLGKLAVGIRVVAMDGSHCGWGRSILRNLMRVVDWLPGFYGIGIISAAVTREHRRLGDFVAGTVVVHVERTHGSDAALGARPDPNCHLNIRELEALLPRMEHAMLRALDLLRRRQTLLKEAFSNIAGQVRHEMEQVLGPQEATDDIRFLEHVMYLQQELVLPQDVADAVRKAGLTAEELRKARKLALATGRKARAERQRLIDSLRGRGLGYNVDDMTLWQVVVHVAMQDPSSD